MKKISTFLFAFSAGAAAVIATAAPAITNVEPPFWWTGMANDTLQIMLTGPDIASANFKLDYPGVKIDREVALDSRNYKFLYITVAKDAEPGKMEFKYELDGKHGKLPYELKARTQDAADYKGFDAGDVLYLLMPDRFAKGLGDEEIDMSGLDYPVGADRSNPNARHGGDMRGIRNHLNYIDSLGVTAIWVCPVLENDMPGGSYHGYSTTNYYKIDPRFGSNEEWNSLIEEAHAKGLKVVMDLIFNHSGSNHPWVKDMPSHNWLNHPDRDVMTNYRLTTVHDPYVSDYDLDRTVNGWFVPMMPDLNQRNPHLMKYLTQNSIWWIENSKIDGIRMDTYPYADMNAMSQWAADVLREYPNFNIVGECWYSNEAGSAFWQKGNKLNPTETNLPSVMDFFYILNGRKSFNEDTTPWTGLNYVYDHLAQDFMYPNPQNVLTFLDNHDSDRFLAEMPDSIGSWKQAIAFLLTSRGIPQVYYGTELLMNGSKEGSDGYVRRDFPGGFPGDEVNAFSPEGRTPLQNEAWNYMSKILNWRRGEARDVIAKGRLKHFMPQNGIYAYQRKLGDKEIVVLLNGRDVPNTVTMERTEEILPYGKTLRNILTDSDVTIKEEMTFAPREVMILQNW
ncbi:MAG: glycoside hydrolase family 13 protein [Candidatus Amulumruptor caecigallinarius]|nr:glycoside hydrolase family 13 protein [Candidatus Amulumruptor caecigallinarius]